MTEQKKAKESKLIKRAREKLGKRIKKEEQNITPETLLKVSESINRWLKRHSSERIDLKEHSITQLDKTDSKAPLSDSIKKLREELLKQGNSSEPLQGRVQKGFSSDK